MDEPKRAKRRRNRDRMVQKAKWLQRHVWGTLETIARNLGRPDFTYTDPDIDAKKVADNLAFCQHAFCQLPRKKFGPPSSEIAATQEQLWMEPCDECLGAWNENCASWCPNQRVLKI